MMKRRDALRLIGGAAAALGSGAFSQAQSQEVSMAHTLPNLPYAPDALEPHIDKMTMEIHHGKHHRTYVEKLNEALASAGPLANATLEQLLADNCAAVQEGIRRAVRNNGGGHANHRIFWQLLGPDGGRPGAG